MEVPRALPARREASFDEVLGPVVTPTYPRVSILIPSYNYGRYIGRAIGSARAQAYPNLEIVVSDNASTDDSHAVIAAAAAQDSRIRFWVNETNIGAHANFQLVQENAEGEYLVFLSADDVMYPGHVAEAIEYYTSHPECDLRYTGWTIIDPSGSPLYVWPHRGTRGARTISARDEFVFGLTANGHVRFHTVVFPKRVLDAIGPYATDVLAADTEFLFRCARAGYTFAYDSRPFIGYLLHEHSASSHQNFVVSGVQLHDWLTIYDRNLNEDTSPACTGSAGRIGRVVEDAVRSVAALPPEHSAEIFARERELLERVRSKIAAIPRRLTAAQAPFPRFSVILPTVGNVALLRQSLDSVARQSEGSWEVLVIDNGGPNVESVVRELSLGEHLVYAQSMQTDNAASARNLGLRLARGESIAYIDEGDTWPADYLKSVAEALDRNDADIVRSNAVAVYYGVREREIEPALARDEDVFGLAGTAIADEIGIYTPLSAIAHRKHCFEAIGEFNETYLQLEDWDFLMRLTQPGKGFTVATSPARVESAYYRGLAFQALGRRFYSLGSALQTIYGQRATNDARTTMRRNERLTRIVAAANVFLANSASIEALRACVRALFTDAA